MARRKIITLDYQDLSSYDDSDEIMVCLTQRQIAILKALLVTAYWQTRWQNSTQSKDELEADMSAIDYRLDGNDCECEMTIFREKPGDPCEVQYSNDSGITWTLMFRKDNCGQPATEGDITNIYNDNDLIITNNVTWNGNIINIAPDWEWTSSLSDKALCFVINQYVDDICDFAVSQIESENVERREANDWMNDLSDIISTGIISGIAAVPATPIVVPAIVVGAVTYAVSRFIDTLYDWWVGLDATPWQDENARQAVKCAMYYNLKGATPQFGVWEASMANWATFGGNAKTIGQTIDRFNDEVDYYINYLLLWEDINSVTAYLPECPCPSTWIQFFDFENFGLGGWLAEGDYGEYIPGYGVGSQTRHETTWYDNLVQDIVLKLDGINPSVVPRCTDVEFHMDCVRGDFDNNLTCAYLIVSPLAPWSANSGFITTGNPGWKHSFSETILTTVALGYLRACHTENGLGNFGNIVVTGMTLYGNGQNPFYGHVTS